MNSNVFSQQIYLQVVGTEVYRGIKDFGPDFMYSYIPNNEICYFPERG